MVERPLRLTKDTYYLPKLRQVVQSDGRVPDDWEPKTKRFVPMPRRELATELVAILSYRCNLHCVYCSTDAGMGDGSVLSMDQFRGAANTIMRNHCLSRFVKKGGDPKPARFILTGGGEPTVEWDLIQQIVDYIGHIKEQEPAVELILQTNAQMPAARRHYVLDNFDRVYVSCDGVSVHDRHRPRFDGSGSWNLVEELLGALDRRKKFSGIRMTVTGAGVPTLESDVDMLFDKFPSIGVVDIEPVAYVGRMVQESVMTAVDAKEFDQVYDVLARRYPGRIASFSANLEDRWGYACGRLAGSSVVLTPSGAVTACDTVTPRDKDWNGFTIGVADTDGLRILNEPAVVGVRAKECAACFAEEFCYGACPVRVKRGPDGTVLTAEGRASCRLIKRMVRSTLIRELDINGEEASDEDKERGILRVVQLT